MSDDVWKELFHSYVDKAIGYGALFLACTIGVFSPLTILSSALISNAPLPVGFKVVLVSVYLLFSVGSGLALEKGLANILLFHEVMPKDLKQTYETLQGKYDLTSFGVHTFGSRMRWAQVFALLLPPVLYILLLALLLV